MGSEVRTVCCQGGGPQRNHRGLVLNMHIPMETRPPSNPTQPPHHLAAMVLANAAGRHSNRLNVTLLEFSSMFQPQWCGLSPNHVISRRTRH